jgi:hypothetical protein
MYRPGRTAYLHEVGRDIGCLGVAAWQGLYDFGRARLMVV